MLTIIIVNRISETIFSNLEILLNKYPDEHRKLLTLFPGTANFLQQKGYSCELLQVHRHQDRIESMNRLGLIANGEMFKNFKIPGSELLAWKSAMHDRFWQFTDFETFDEIHKLVNLLHITTLIAPIDIHDHLSQYMMRQANKNGIPTIGYQVTQLRTKENLDVYLGFNEYWVYTLQDKLFLSKHKDVPEEHIHLLPYYYFQPARNYARTSFNMERKKIKENLGLPTDKKLILILFSIRHIWECRKLLAHLQEIKASSPLNFAQSKIVMFLETQKEMEEFPALFKNEIQLLGLEVVPPAANLFKYARATDSFFAFQFLEHLDEIALLSAQTVIYDPYYFNRSDVLMSDSKSIQLDNSKNSPDYFVATH